MTKKTTNEYPTWDDLIEEAQHFIKYLKEEIGKFEGEVAEIKKKGGINIIGKENLIKYSDEIGEYGESIKGVFEDIDIYNDDE